MPNTNTLQPSQRRESKQRDFLGGTFENLENISDTILGTGLGFTTESPVGGDEAKNLQKMPELKTGFQFPTKGELRFSTPSAEARKKQILAELAVAHNQTVTQAPVKNKREKINNLNGLQGSYTGSVDSEGNATEYHGTNAEQKEREDAKNQALQIQNERAAKLAATRGRGEGMFVGENDLINNEAQGWKNNPG